MTIHYHWQISLVAQMVKCLPKMRETWVPPLGKEDLLGKGMATHSSILDTPTPQPPPPKKKKKQLNEDLKDLLELKPKKDILFIIGEWNAKVGSQEIPGVTGEFGLGVKKMKQGKDEQNFAKRTH